MSKSIGKIHTGVYSWVSKAKEIGFRGINWVLRGSGWEKKLRFERWGGFEKN